MRLYPVCFTAFIGLLLTLAGVLATYPSHTNQEVFTRQLIRTATLANHEIATNMATSNAVEAEWIGGSSSEADLEWSNSLVAAFNRAYNERHYTANLPSIYNKRVPDFVADGSLAANESRTVDSDESNGGLQNMSNCTFQDASTLALVNSELKITDTRRRMPSADWVWDDLRKAAEALTDQKNGYDLSLSTDKAHPIASISQVNTATMPAHMSSSAW